MINSARLLWVVGFLLLLGGEIEAEISTWKLGGEGLAWSGNDSTSILIDFESAPGAIRPVYIAPDRTVFSYLSNWSPLKFPRDLGFVEGERPRAWKGGRGSEATVSNGTYLVDGDSTTYNPSSTAGIGGDWYTIDLAVPVPAERFGFYTPSQGFRGDGRLLREDVVPAFEVSIAAEGDPSWLESGTYRPLGALVADVQENFDADVKIDFPRQYVRYVRYRRKLSVQDRNLTVIRTSGGVASTGTIGDFELFGEGVPRRAIYVTRIFDLGGEVNFGRIFWAATPMQAEDGGPVAAPEVAVAVRVEARSGRDDDPDVYHEYTDSGKEKVVSRQRYEFDLKPGDMQRAKPGMRASIAYDTDNWTYWSPPTTSSGGPIGLDSGSHLQLRVILESDKFDAFIRLDSLWIETAPLLAHQVVGEVARLDDPQPARGFTEVEVGEMTDFVYQLRTEFAGAGEQGFDGVRIRTGHRAEFRQLQMGSPPRSLEPAAVTAEEEGLVVLLPERITRSSNQPIRISFGTEVFLYANTFEGEVFDTATPGLPQPVEAGDVTTELSTNSLRVLGKAGSTPDFIQHLELSSQVLTPNGDGINDELVIRYTLYRLPNRIPVHLNVYTLNGRRVKRLTVGDQGSGQQQLSWDCRDELGQRLTPGVYLVEVALESEFGEARQLRSLGIAY